ncbi:MAG: 50S ribosomal protein L25/general stress protein Ctc [Gammaproteobacteria bacterium]|jgi:large subunit ribosomal protein L25|nr:50S ribosomal protein L25/general stress protein Ctc [Gammaproteobacteria bacterium]MBT3489300.1 50S ribosomal protein L25/general stress protein Ctc [Gammaproteobacteria bacterium]MBT3718680.1 50S ribosomal protein L25/general stress protein Ctc [Gammaproteobacteria bacterium]MBT3843776.1 50S ribosomal protein L25/general stress protein Ctc [Gammaproteobacteria bacterium]MBT3893998.1 50S ribosomal protein L25/general stress protein Ctc [Gammaproteobacteria bacterium]
MSSSFEMQASVRSDLGKAHTRRLRNTGSVPAVIYGDDREPASITMVHDDLMHNLEKEAFYSHILSIDVDGTKESVVLKDLQRHPAKAKVIHADFLRISSKHEMKMSVPLHFLNDDAAPGITQGGALNKLISNLEVSCLASNLPEYIEVDLTGLDLGDSIRLSQLSLPEGVSVTALSRGDDHDQAVVTLQKTRGSKADDDEEEGEISGTEGEAEAEA